MNLIIDLGNTHAKLAGFDEDTLRFIEVIGKDEIEKKISTLSRKHSFEQAILSSVVKHSDKIVATVQKICPMLILNPLTPVPFQNNYGSPETLGVDRIALAAAAINEYKNQNVLVIDAGSCITYEFISEKGVYMGGAISPGVEMRYKAMHSFTDKLPLLKTTAPDNIIGNSTEQSMHSGVVNGVVHEINGIIEQYHYQFQKLTVVLTGGSTKFLAERLKNSIFAHPNFLLEGLNTILTYNTQND